MLNFLHFLLILIKSTLFFLIKNSRVRDLRNYLKIFLSTKSRRNISKTVKELEKKEYSLIRKAIKSKNSELKDTALVFGKKDLENILLQLPILISLISVGKRPIILIDVSSNIIPEKIYKSLGFEIFDLSKMIIRRNLSLFDLFKLTKINNQKELVEYSHNNISVGKYAASSVMRKTRLGDLNFESFFSKNLILISLMRAINLCAEASYLLKKFKPSIAIFVDRGYSPEGQLFDECINSKIDVITMNSGHKNNALVFKRFNNENKDKHFLSLSNSSLAIMREMNFGSNKIQESIDEITECYLSGEWYGEVATQITTKEISSEQIMTNLGIKDTKKIVLLFPHIFWDATFFWGEDVFENYEVWFRESVRAAIQNDSVYWLIKIHPANIVKNVRENISSYFSELKVLDEFRPLPEHIKIINADTDISTLSLFSIGDFCLTVRGTVGLEAAMFGLKTITCGTGRYDGIGFTNDNKKKEDYLELLKNLDKKKNNLKINPELAARYAYFVYKIKTFETTLIKFNYSKDRKAELEIKLNLTDKDIFLSKDILKLSEWLVSKDEDMVNKDLIEADNE